MMLSPLRSSLAALCMLVALTGCRIPQSAPKSTLIEQPATQVAPFEKIKDTDTKALLALADAICPGAARVDPPESMGPPRVVCGVCPAGSDDEGSEGDVWLSAAFVGDLRGDRSRVALVDLDGCASHAANYGGSALVEQVDGRWGKVVYSIGQRVSGCDPVMYQGAGMFLCSIHDMHQGYATEAWWLLQITAQGSRELFGVSMGCNEGGCPQAREACWETTSATIADADGDGQDDLVWTGVVTMSSLKGGIGEDVLDECPEQAQVPYDVEKVEVARVMTRRGDKLVEVPAASIKDAKLRARIEALAQVPEPEL
jgi:hypothetical protein